MTGVDLAWAVVIGLMLAGLLAALGGMTYLAWRAWKHEAAAWRWPALAGLGLALLGGGISLVRILAALG